MELYQMREQVAEANRKAQVANEAKDKAIEDLRRFKEHLGVKEKFGGILQIDYSRFIEVIGDEGRAQLRELLGGGLPHLAGQPVVVLAPKQRKPRAKAEPKQVKPRITVTADAVVVP
jgi:hypothetical protein